MAEKSTVHNPETIDGRTLKVVPLPRLRLPLKSAEDVRREMARLYRDMRANKLDKADGCKMAYVLDRIGKLIEVEQVGQRLAELERKLLK